MNSDPDFIPENIVSGTNILGVVGTLVEGMNTLTIDAGLFASCIVNSAGVAKCWGAGTTGQIGDNNFSTPQAPYSSARAA
jgi:hypothetical protein